MLRPIAVGAAGAALLSVLLGKPGNLPRDVALGAAGGLLFHVWNQSQWPSADEMGAISAGRYGPPPATVRTLAELSGCRVLAANRLHDGGLAYRVTCSDHRAKVGLLANLAEYDARTPDVRRFAEQIVAGARDTAQQARALHAFVRDRVVFTREPIETFSPTMHTLTIGAGDCDDSARALMALALALGLRARLETLPPLSSGRTPKHVAAQLFVDGAWRWAETTIAGELGEHPVAAARRLGVVTRGDIT
jgi:transglutaminase-like putative cysteine protease